MIKFKQYELGILYLSDEQVFNEPHTTSWMGYGDIYLNATYSNSVPVCHFVENCPHLLKMILISEALILMAENNGNNVSFHLF